MRSKGLELRVGRVTANKKNLRMALLETLLSLFFLIWGVILLEIDTLSLFIVCMH